MKVFANENISWPPKQLDLAKSPELGQKSIFNLISVMCPIWITFEQFMANLKLRHKKKFSCPLIQLD